MPVSVYLFVYLIAGPGPLAEPPEPPEPPEVPAPKRPLVVGLGARPRPSAAGNERPRSESNEACGCFLCFFLCFFFYFFFGGGGEKRTSRDTPVEFGGWAGNPRSDEALLTFMYK